MTDLEALRNSDFLHQHASQTNKDPSEGPVAEASEPAIPSDPSDKAQTSRRMLPLPSRRSTKPLPTKDEMITAGYRWLKMHDPPKESQTVPVAEEAQDTEGSKIMDEFEFDLRKLCYVMMTSPNYNSTWFIPEHKG